MFGISAYSFLFLFSLCFRECHFQPAEETVFSGAGEEKARTDLFGSPSTVKGLIILTDYGTRRFPENKGHANLLNHK